MVSASILFFFYIAASATEEVMMWGVDEVIAWAEKEKLAEEVIFKFRKHGVVGRALLSINVKRLEEMQITSQTMRESAMAHIQKLPKPGTR